MTSAGTNVVWAGLQEPMFRAVNQFSRHTAWLHAPARLYAVYGVGIFALLLLVSWLLARRTGDMRRIALALWAPIAALVAIGINQILVTLVGESRPYRAIPETLILVHRSTDFSLPSDHSVMAGAVAAGVWMVHRKLGLLAVGLAVLMAADRVYVGAHFPLDVVSGLIVGAVLVWGSARLAVPLLDPLLRRLSRSPWQPLVGNTR